MHHKKILFGALIGLSLLGAGCSLTQTVNINQPANANSANVNAVAARITYSGQTGKNALDLLKSTHQIDVSAQGFVNAIDGVKPGDHQYWSFYVNGKLADVGAKDYQTKNTDSIEWKLEAF